MDVGLNKYITLKLDEAYEQSLEKLPVVDHMTSDEEKEISMKEMDTTS